MKFFLSRLASVLLLTTLFVSGWMLMFEDQYIYYPTREIHNTPETVGLKFQDIHLTTGDGIALHGWLIPHPNARFTLLHFHGNAGNISHRLHLYEQWHRMGLSLFAIDYRGYGKSEGTPSEAGFYSDARAAWKELVKRQKVPASQIIIAGRSLGCAVAAKLATETKPAALVMETPFTSIPDMAAEHYPWIIPIQFLTQTQFNTLDLIGQVDAPTMVISAENDEIVPTIMSEKIYAGANEPKQFVTLSGNHNDFDIVSSSTYARAWNRWLNQLDGGVKLPANPAQE
ncbi:MAG: alpha/beta fold hydrolase [Mariprofundaceae bacterium]|nr:alpha/beta fold hydrolase [Mariprofundaceae bacterium]